MDDQHRKTTNAIYEWLRIREEHGTPMPADSRAFFVDADHSSLLQRLLNGQRPLPEPPPKNMSYPWYHLIEMGHGLAFEVWEPTGQDHEGMICIDQCFWHVIKKLGPSEWIATYEYTGLDMEATTKVYVQKRSESQWRVYADGEAMGRAIWHLERI